MANEEHVARLKRGVAEWNMWRQQYPDIRPDLGKVDLRCVSIDGADFSHAYLGNANFSQASLNGANLSNASLNGADFSNASLDGANISDADFDRADFSQASLIGADLSCDTLKGAFLNKKRFRRTQLLSEAGPDFLRVPTLEELAYVLHHLLNRANFSSADLL